MLVLLYQPGVSIGMYSNQRGRLTLQRQSMVPLWNHPRRRVGCSWISPSRTGSNEGSVEG